MAPESLLAGGPSPPVDTACVVVCTEAGRLGHETLLLVRSLRERGGRLSGLPVYSFCPRPGRDIGLRRQRQLADLGVVHTAVPLNLRYPDYPFANKPLACAFAERELDHPVIIFLDSDIVVLAEPTDLLPPAGLDMMLRPVDLKGIGAGADDPDDPNRAYWDLLYQVAGHPDVDRGSVTTTVDRVTIDSYWNSGVIGVRREAGLFQAWLDVFERVMATGGRPAAGPRFVDQAALAAAVRIRQARVGTLPPAYNYPLHLHRRLPTEQRLGLAEIRCAHYHRLFRRPDPLAHLDPADHRQKTWLLERARQAGVIRPPVAGDLHERPVPPGGVPCPITA